MQGRLLWTAASDGCLPVYHGRAVPCRHPPAPQHRRVHDALENAPRAVKWYRAALKADPFNYEVGGAVGAWTWWWWCVCVRACACVCVLQMLARDEFGPAGLPPPVSLTHTHNTRGSHRRSRRW